MTKCYIPQQKLLIPLPNSIAFPSKFSQNATLSENPRKVTIITIALNSAPTRLSVMQHRPKNATQIKGVAVFAAKLDFLICPCHRNNYANQTNVRLL
jgi:hypothetical protein